MTTLQDRKLGCFWGLLVGDALGMPLEGSRPPFDLVDDYRDGWLPAGCWTDDSSMALALADSLITAGFSPSDQLDRYVAWYRRGQYSSYENRCVDIGSVTRTALDTWIRGSGWEDCGQRHSRSASNGSLMRLAPIPIRYQSLVDSDPDELYMFALDASRTTHAHPECTECCSYLALVLAGLMAGGDRETTLDPIRGPYGRLTAYAGNDRGLQMRDVIYGSYRTSQAIEARGGVVKTLEAALWAFHDAPDFETAVLRAVNLGRDSDTVGAVTGQLAGAYWGIEGIPLRWREGLARREYVGDIINQLVLGKEGA